MSADLDNCETLISFQAKRLNHFRRIDNEVQKSHHRITSESRNQQSIEQSVQEQSEALEMLKVLYLQLFSPKKLDNDLTQYTKIEQQLLDSEDQIFNVEGKLLQNTIKEIQRLKVNSHIFQNGAKPQNNNQLFTLIKKQQQKIGKLTKQIQFLSLELHKRQNQIQEAQHESSRLKMLNESKYCKIKELQIQVEQQYSYIEETELQKQKFEETFRKLEFEKSFLEEESKKLLEQSMINCQGSEKESLFKAEVSERLRQQILTEISAQVQSEILNLQNKVQSSDPQVLKQQPIQCHKIDESTDPVEQIQFSEEELEQAIPQIQQSQQKCTQNNQNMNLEKTTTGRSNNQLFENSMECSFISSSPGKYLESIEMLTQELSAAYEKINELTKQSRFLQGFNKRLNQENLQLKVDLEKNLQGISLSSEPMGQREKIVTPKSENKKSLISHVSGFWK